MIRKLWEDFWEWRFNRVRDRMVRMAAVQYIIETKQVVNFMAFYLNKYPPRREVVMTVSLDCNQVRKTALEFIRAQGEERIDEFADWFDGVKQIDVGCKLAVANVIR